MRHGTASRPAVKVLVLTALACFVLPATARRAFLHIGAHKTGSTSLQTYLSLHGGFGHSLKFPHVCPKRYHRGSPPYGFAALGQVLCELPRIDASRLRLPAGCPDPISAYEDALAATTGDFIVSSEGFEFCDETGLTRVRDFLLRFADEVQVIAFRRAPLDYAISCLRQQEKGRAIDNIAKEILLHGLQYDGNSCRGISGDCIDMLSSVFGGDRLHVISFEGFASSGKGPEDVVACDVIGVPECRDGRVRRAAEPPSHANVTPGPFVYDTVAIFNVLSGSLGCSQRIDVRSPLAQDIFADIEPFLPVRPSTDNAKDQMLDGSVLWCIPKTALPFPNTGISPWVDDPSSEVHWYYFEDLREDDSPFCGLDVLAAVEDVHMRPVFLRHLSHSCDAASEALRRESIHLTTGAPSRS